MADSVYTIETTLSPGDTVQFLEDRIYEHNSSTIKKYDGSPFSKIIRGPKREIIAGISGWTWATACEISALWVKEEYRNRQLGTRLLASAEEEAIRNKCTVIIVKSYSFQAPFFYQKYGYEIAHIMDDFPKGYRYYTLTKALK